MKIPVRQDRDFFILPVCNFFPPAPVLLLTKFASMKKIVVLSFVIIGLIVACSCSFGLVCKEGTGGMKTEHRDVSSFSNISLEMSAKVEIKQGSETAVSVTASENLFKYIDTRVKNNTLMIDVKDCNCLRSEGDIVIKVTTPSIHGLTVNGSGDIISEGRLQIDKLNCKINGSGSISLMDLQADDYSIDINGSGDVVLEGSSSKTGEININGSGDVNTSKVATSALVVNVSGSGDVTVKPTAALDVEITGSGDVRYYGTPAISRHINGSGDVEQVK